MKVIFETPPVHGSFTDSRLGLAMTGYASFAVYMALPGEDLPALPTVEATRNQCRTLSELRTRAGPGRPIVAKAGPNNLFPGVFPEEITIPDYVFESLPEDALLRFTWNIHTTKEVPQL